MDLENKTADHVAICVLERHDILHVTIFIVIRGHSESARVDPSQSESARVRISESQIESVRTDKNQPEKARRTRTSQYQSEFSQSQPESARPSQRDK